MKKTYIIPAAAIECTTLASGLLLSASNGEGKGLLGNGGSTEGSITTADSRDNAWDIWGDDSNNDSY